VTAASVAPSRSPSPARARTSSSPTSTKTRTRRRLRGSSRRPGADACWHPGISPTRRTADQVIDRVVEEFGGVDALASNSAYQMTHQSLDEISDEECAYTFRLNVGA
jgi:NAD(P)-dependent dehydrogenase (short-subunit alcohol dehydrogenase family)